MKRHTQKRVSTKFTRQDFTTQTETLYMALCYGGVDIDLISRWPRARVHDAAAVGHLVLVGVLAVVVVVHRVHDAQVQHQPVQHARQLRVRLLLRRALGRRLQPQQLLLLRGRFFDQMLRYLMEYRVFGVQAEVLLGKKSD